MKASREAVAAQIVERAKTAEGKPGDVPLLDDAASLLAEGRSVLRNRDVAVAFFERSWLAGSTYAAKGLADLYQSGDLDNAYLWSVRNKTPGVVWTSRIEGLSPEAIHNAEAVASNKSILSMRADKAGPTYGGRMRRTSAWSSLFW
jgi:TPR repeat protein